MLEKPLISFDYAIKYLIRTKSDYDIIEGFISALFAAQGYKPVKINSVLESASNKESKHLKSSVADLVVEDIDGNKYLVEIERSFTNNFMHKACFNTSRLVIDNISGNQDYTKIKKVFHISLLYFAVSEMPKPIYHGQTIIHEIDTAHPADIRIVNQGNIPFENHNIFPEYFFISVPRFNDTIHQEIDEWLYMMKYSDTKSDFKSPYMKKVAEKLRVLKMNDEERIAYFRYLKETVHSQDILGAARQKGMEEGIEKGIEKGIDIGRREGIEKTAINMLEKNLDITLISSVTGLPTEHILKLKDKI